MLAKQRMRILFSVAALSIAGTAAHSAGDTEAAQLEVLEAAEAAWNRSDVEGMLAFYSPDAEHVNASNGFYWKGHEELKAGWTWALDLNGGADQYPVSRTFRQLGPDVALVVSRLQLQLPKSVSSQLPDGRTYVEGYTTKVLARMEGRWLIVFSQSTPIDPTPVFQRQQ